VIADFEVTEAMLRHFNTSTIAMCAGETPQHRLVTSKSAITPSLSGRTATIFAGVRPACAWLRPTARHRFVPGLAPLPRMAHVKRSLILYVNKSVRCAEIDPDVAG